VQFDTRRQRSQSKDNNRRVVRGQRWVLASAILSSTSTSTVALSTSTVALSTSTTALMKNRFSGPVPKINHIKNSQSLAPLQPLLICSVMSSLDQTSPHDQKQHDANRRLTERHRQKWRRQLGNGVAVRRRHPASIASNRHTID